MLTLLVLQWGEAGEGCVSWWRTHAHVSVCTAYLLVPECVCVCALPQVCLSVYLNVY